MESQTIGLQGHETQDHGRAKIWYGNTTIGAKCPGVIDDDDVIIDEFIRHQLLGVATGHAEVSDVYNDDGSSGEGSAYLTPGQTSQAPNVEMCAGGAKGMVVLNNNKKSPG
eukprot:12273331-Karenia_brevis.AAC.1